MSYVAGFQAEKETSKYIRNRIKQARLAFNNTISIQTSIFDIDLSKAMYGQF